MARPYCGYKLKTSNILTRLFVAKDKIVSYLNIFCNIYFKHRVARLDHATYKTGFLYIWHLFCSLTVLIPWMTIDDENSHENEKGTIKSEVFFLTLTCSVYNMIRKVAVSPFKRRLFSHHLSLSTKHWYESKSIYLNVLLEEIPFSKLATWPWVKGSSKNKSGTLSYLAAKSIGGSEYFVFSFLFNKLHNSHFKTTYAADRTWISNILDEETKNYDRVTSHKATFIQAPPNWVCKVHLSPIIWERLDWGQRKLMPLCAATAVPHCCSLCSMYSADGVEHWC